MDQKNQPPVHNKFVAPGCEKFSEAPTRGCFTCTHIALSPEAAPCSACFSPDYANWQFWATSEQEGRQ